MASRRKSLSEKQVRTIIAAWSSVLEYTKWDYGKLNTFVGSVTIDEMMELYGKLHDWYNMDEIDEEY